ncbi:hypothetical protein HCJ66_00920 [Listeria sp. FSL L7-1582]|uniref:hypothetical protein n=1 Tax=Listeria portnoyi TaxID=2713504 RepID=UPI00164CFD36|nr:hypothetical protein [Listeria portnoyi]MBC6308103.1 hypothetical protein [Listeria portnoyi]
METETKEGVTNYVTQLELLKHGDKIKKELTSDIKEVREDVSDLKEIVIPLAFSAEQTAKNTEKMSETLERFANNTTDHLHKHDLDISKIQGSAEEGTEKKKSNSAIIIALITVTGGLITAIVKLAPLFWN